MQPRHGFRRIEYRAPRQRQRRGGEQQAEVAPRVCARLREPATEPQRAHAEIQQGDQERARHTRQEQQSVHALKPGEPTDIKAQVPMEQRVDDAEARGTRREARRHPPVARAEGQQEAEGETARERTTEQHALGHRFHDLEITQPPRQLDGADGAVDEEHVAGAPGDGEQQDQPAHQPGDVMPHHVHLTARDARCPRPLGGLEGQPATPHQHDDQRGGAGDQPRPPGRARHGRTPCAASQSSTSARYAASADSLPASNRSTRTG